jgi:hypothetical protein
MYSVTTSSLSTVRGRFKFSAPICEDLFVSSTKPVIRTANPNGTMPSLTIIYQHKISHKPFLHPQATMVSGHQYILHSESCASVQVSHWTEGSMARCIHGLFMLSFFGYSPSAAKWSYPLKTENYGVPSSKLKPQKYLPAHESFK